MVTFTRGKSSRAGYDERLLKIKVNILKNGIDTVQHR